MNTAPSTRRHSVKEPRYKALNTCYYPDSCLPLIQAVDAGKIQFVGLKRFNYPGMPMPTKVLPGVNSIGYWDAKEVQQWGLDWHRNEGIEFTFLATGRLSFSLGDETYELTPGDLTITRPWQLHKVGNPDVGVSRLYWLIIDVDVRQPHQRWRWPDWVVLCDEDIKKLTTILRQNEKPVWHTGEKFAQCIRQIGYVLNEPADNLSYSRLTLLINEFLLLLLELFTREKKDLELNHRLMENLRTAEIFFEYLTRDYARPWTLELMARHCGLGVTSLTKYCKQLTNLTPINYLNDIRLAAAAEALRGHENSSVSTICYACGFSSNKYFATLFKKKYNCSPTQYRNGR